MKSIGGYFELELNNGQEYHADAIRLNTGRNAFEYILRAKKYRKVYMPYYTCDVMMEPINKLKLDFSLYSIDENFYPIFDFNSIKDDEAFLYTNYFGICASQVKQVSEECKNLIIDNSQAFFDMPIEGVDTFYSARKFFGVPDGAYLYCNKKHNNSLPEDSSISRVEHLIKRIDISAEAGYGDFKKNDLSLNMQEIKGMSKLTKALLSSIDYGYIKSKRLENFNFIHQNIGKTNFINIFICDGIVPLAYPFKTNKKDLKQKLVDNKIYVATYWPNVLHECDKNSNEYCLAKKTIAIPIDQRYDIEDLKRVIKIINE